MCNTVEFLNMALRVLTVQRTMGVSLEQALTIVGYEEHGKQGLRRSAEFRPQTDAEITAALAREREAKRREERRNHLRAIQHGHLFGKNRCCTRCGLLETTYYMEHEHLELDKVITCQNIIDRHLYNAYLGIGVYKPRARTLDP